jgi:hypothetical protein
MENSALEIQIGGNHYKNLQMQPIVFITKANLDFIQGCIVKYISRYKDKNGKQDIEKCIHYAQLAIELLPDEKQYLNLGLGYSYARVNSLNKYQTNIVIAVLQRDFLSVIVNCKALIKAEY